MKKNLLYFHFLILLCFQCYLTGCKKEEEQKEVQPGVASFNLIQTKIFNTSCNNCHGTEQASSFQQHHLLLSEGQSYSYLINAETADEEAKADGLKRVLPGDPDKSLLFNKILCPTGDHAAHSKHYGNPMPAGGAPALSVGQIEFIRRWIAQGAPKDGIIDADPALLDDKTPSCSNDFVPLAPPAAGNGYQLKVDQFEIPSNVEREIFVWKNVGNAKPEYVNKVTLKMRPGSHHFLAQTYDPSTPAEVLPVISQVRELRDLQDQYIMTTLQQMQYHVFGFGSQTPETEFTFPPGVALKIPADHKFDLNVHYVNKTTGTLTGEAYINLFTVEEKEVQHEALPIFLINDELNLPPHTKTLAKKTYTVPANEVWNIVALTSHTHKLGEKFEIKLSGGTRDGETVFTSLDWTHPEFKKFPEPIVLKGGEGLIMEVTFNNTTDQTVSWGLKSTDEMAIISGYYYK